MTGPDRAENRTGDPSTANLETDLELAAIVAVAENGVIGVDGEMPWHLPADLRRFKRLTAGHPVIMGRVTYESILANLGEPLPDRTSVVLTSRGRKSLGDDLETSVHPDEGDDLERPTNVVVASDLQSALEAAERSAREDHGGTERAFVGGGATVYEQFLPAVDRLFVTEIYDRPDGDTHFPAWNRDRWLEVERDDRDGFAFLEYVRCS